METTIEIAKTAILVVDMQNAAYEVKQGFLGATARRAREKDVAGNFAKVIKAAREVGMTIFYIADVHRQDHTDRIPKISDLILKGVLEQGWEGTGVVNTYDGEFIPEIAPLPEDYVIKKRRFDAFFGTELELQLRCLGIDTIIIGGLVTDICVLATVVGADQRDFNIIVLSDCTSTSVFQENTDYVAVDNLFMSYLFPITSRVRTSDEVVTAMRSVIQKCEEDQMSEIDGEVSR